MWFPEHLRAANVVMEAVVVVVAVAATTELVAVLAIDDGDADTDYWYL